MEVKRKLCEERDAVGKELRMTTGKQPFGDNLSSVSNGFQEAFP